MNSVLGVGFVFLISCFIGLSAGYSFECYNCRFSNHSGSNDQSSDSCISSPKELVDCPSKRCTTVETERNMKDSPTKSYSIQRGCQPPGGRITEGTECFSEHDGFKGVSTKRCTCGIDKCNTSSSANPLVQDFRFFYFLLAVVSYVGFYKY